MSKFKGLFLAISILLIPITGFSAKGTLLDKVVGIINDHVITLSTVNRIKNTAPQRNMMSPFVYNKKKLSRKDVIDLIMQTKIIRAGLSDLGYIIRDDDVESTVNQRQKQLGINRKQLAQQLKSFKISFEEYFEIIRATIEFNHFTSKIIAPLVSITDQEIKNLFFKKHAKNKSLTFRYNLIDYSISKKKVSKKNKGRLKSQINTYRNKGNLPSHLKGLETDSLGDITEDGLNNAMKRELKNTPEGSLTKPILLGGQYHVFFVKTKNVTESTYFQENKNKIRAGLFKKESKKMIAIWVEREKHKHYIKVF